MDKRRSLKLISPFQRWFLFSSFGFTILTVILIGFGLLTWFRLLISELNQLAGIMSPTLVELIQKQEERFLIFAVASVVVLTIVLCAFTYLMSRKIAGPIASLMTHLDRCIEQQAWTPFKLRKGDLFPELPKKLNQVIENNEGRKKST